jgi:hypothetical protein
VVPKPLREEQVLSTLAGAGVHGGACYDALVALEARRTTRRC